MLVNQLYLIIIAIILACISSVITASNFISTIIARKDSRIRLIGMLLISWALLISSLLLILTMPVLVSAVILLLLDRRFNTAFYEPKARSWSNNVPTFVFILWTSRSLCINTTSIWNNKRDHIEVLRETCFW